MPWVQQHEHLCILGWARDDVFALQVLLGEMVLKTTHNLEGCVCYASGAHCHGSAYAHARAMAGTSARSRSDSDLRTQATVGTPSSCEPPGSSAPLARGLWSLRSATRSKNNKYQCDRPTDTHRRQLSARTCASAAHTNTNADTHTREQVDEAGTLEQWIKAIALSSLLHLMGDSNQVPVLIQQAQRARVRERERERA